MPDSKISDLVEGTVVDKDNDFLLFVDSSDTTQNPLTGSTKKIKPANMPIGNKQMKEVKRISLFRS